MQMAFFKKNLMLACNNKDSCCSLTQIKVLSCVNAISKTRWHHIQSYYTDTGELPMPLLTRIHTFNELKIEIEKVVNFW